MIYSVTKIHDIFSDQDFDIFVYSRFMIYSVTKIHVIFSDQDSDIFSDQDSDIFSTKILNFQYQDHEYSVTKILIYSVTKILIYSGPRF